MPGYATQARAAFDAAQAEVAQADINLQRTQVRSPVNGYVKSAQKASNVEPPAKRSDDLMRHKYR
jgi:multidrug efflux pump subunit AcrA (membrane-fusion protein)